MGKTLENLTVPELKERLRAKNLPVSGAKADLIKRLRPLAKKGSKGNDSVPDNVLDRKLYLRIKNKIKKRVNAWPSAYASGMLVKEYKAAGGRYKGRKSGDAALTRWFEERWIDVCELPKKVACGRPKGSAKGYDKDYPYCRPSKRVNSKTPKTVAELSKAALAKRCARKKAAPKKRVY